MQASQREARPVVVDALLGALVAAVLAFVMATAPGGEREPDAGAYTFAVGLGALVLLRRRMPRAVLVLSALATFAYYSFDYPPIGVAVPVLAALGSAAEAGRARWAVGTAAVVYAVSMFFRIREGGESLGALVGVESVTNLALCAAAIAAGAVVRARRIAAAQRVRIAALVDAQFDREVASRVRAERERMSRELHDSVGHALSVVSLQSAAALEAVGRDDDAARAALGRVRATSGDALRELRSIVRILREHDDPDAAGAAAPLAGLAGLDTLVRSAADAGLVVHLDRAGTPAVLAPSVDTAAYRVVQEAVTNVIRHAGASAVHVDVRGEGDDLVVCVRDDGTGFAPRGAEAPGLGTTGMFERVRLLGGDVRIEPSPRGTRVEARIPMRSTP